MIILDPIIKKWSREMSPIGLWERFNRRSWVKRKRSDGKKLRRLLEKSNDCSLDAVLSIITLGGIVFNPRRERSREMAPGSDELSDPSDLDPAVTLAAVLVRASETDTVSLTENSAEE